MTKPLEGEIYHWEKADIMACAVSAGSAATLQISMENEPFIDVLELPLAGGDNIAQVQLRNCRFRFTGITGTVTFKPDARQAE